MSAHTDGWERPVQVGVLILAQQREIEGAAASPDPGEDDPATQRAASAHVIATPSESRNRSHD